MNNDDRMAWKKTPLPWQQLPDGDVVDAKGRFVEFHSLTTGQLCENADRAASEIA